MVRFPANEKQFWLDLNIRLEEFCALRLGDLKHSKRLFRILKSSEQTWYRLLIKDFNANGSGGLFSFLQIQYHQNPILFCELYALKKFSDNIVDQELIINKAREILGADFSIYEALTADDPRGLILPVFYRNRDAIIDLYCENIFKISSIKTYNSVLGFSQGQPTAITRENIQRIMNGFQRNHRRDKRQIQVFWVFSQNGTIKIIFRRDKRSSTVIKKTAHNEAVKTADQKILIFTENGSKLSAYLGRERNKTLEIAQYLAGKLFGRTMIFNEDIINKPVVAIDNFIAAIKESNPVRVRLLALTAINSPSTNLPRIEIRSRGRGLINEDINYLTSHALPLTASASDIQSVTVLIQEQKFKIQFEIQGNSVIIKCSDKGYNAERKRIISEYFDTFIPEDTHANSN